MLHVDIHCDTVGTHLLQIFSGLFQLQEQGRISIGFKVGLDLTSARPNRQFLALRVFANKKSAVYKTILFDLQDSPILGLPDVFDKIDWYVKRSLEPESYNGLSEINAKKIVPFGFNYQVLGFSPLFLFKMFAMEFMSVPYNPFSKKHQFHEHNLKDIFDASWFKKKNGLLSVSELSPCKSVENAGKVLFQCRLWGLDHIAAENRDDAKKINLNRIALIRELKRTLGQWFVGGLQDTPCAREQAPDLISAMPTSRRDYIQLVRDSAVVISTSGLLKSNGWKLGEYVALGKAIVSESITTSLPGVFSGQKNYLQYESIAKCIENVELLISAPEKIASMEKNNREYYENYLQPASQIWNVLKITHN